VNVHPPHVITVVSAAARLRGAQDYPNGSSRPPPGPVRAPRAPTRSARTGAWVSGRLAARVGTRAQSGPPIRPPGAGASRTPAGQTGQSPAPGPRAPCPGENWRRKPEASASPRFRTSLARSRPGGCLATHGRAGPGGPPSSGRKYSRRDPRRTQPRAPRSSSVATGGDVSPAGPPRGRAGRGADP